MPIKSLEPFLFENYSVGNYPIDILRNSTIGIDLSHYVSRLLTFKKEPFIELIGGFPITLLSNMENDLKIFKELNIKPIFVISGLSNQLDFEFKASDGLNSAERVRANKWEYAAKNIKIDTFRDYHTPLSFNVFDIIEFFNKHELEYLIAPYHSTQQLYYMLQQNIIDVIYGSTDLLLFPLPLEKYIFCIEFQNREFKFLDKSYILNRLSLNEKQFVEIAMCCGNDYQPFKMNLFQPGLDITFQQLHDFVINGGSIYNSILQSPFQDRFFKGLSMLKFQPILNTQGQLEIYKTNLEDKLPNDLHEFIGQKLSNEYYYYQSLGITDFKIVETILFGTYLERLSPDCNPHKYYLALANDTDLVNKILNLSTNFMHRYYQFKKYNMKIILPNETKILELSSRLSQPIYLTVKKLHYKISDSKGNLEIATFFQDLADHLKINTLSLTNESKLSNNTELLGSSIARSLYLWEDLINQDGELVKFGQVLSLVKSKESLLFLLFLAKFNKQLKTSDIGANKFEILSKILSIYHVHHLKPVNYSNKISQSLLQFNSIFSKLQEKFNELVTSNLMTILFNNEFGRKFQYQQKDWYFLVNSNPFNKQFNSALLGILSDSFFNNFSSVDTSISNLNGSFATVFVDQLPYDVLCSGFEWYHGEFMLVIFKLDELQLLDKSIVAAFKEADDWLVENIFV